MAPEKGSTELNNYEFSVSITKSRFDQWNNLFKKQTNAGLNVILNVTTSY